MKECEKCKGQGFIEVDGNNRRCPVCKGHGIVFDEGKREEERDRSLTSEADKIRAMSDERLAEFLSKETLDAWYRQSFGKLPRLNGKIEWLDWLKKEAQ